MAKKGLLDLEPEQFADWIPADDPQMQAAFAHALAAFASRDPAYALPTMYPMQPAAPGIEIGPVGKNRIFAVIAYRAEAGAVLPAHDHPNYSVATIGVSGEVLVSQFEVDGDTPPPDRAGPFRVRKTTERMLRTGDAVTLSPVFDNIHTFRAGPQGATWIDVTVPHGPDIGFSYLAISRAIEADVGDRLEADWIR